MIKIFPESLDVNTPTPMGSFLFVKDLVTYSHDNFQIASSAESADCIMLPQFSNNPTGASYLFDKEKADYLASIKKPIILQNDGGGVPDEWKESGIGKYIWNEYSDLIKVFFSVECYDWHRNKLPTGINYAPYDFLGFSDFGLGLREVPQMQSKEQYLNRALDTSVAMSVYPPTRDKLWELLYEENWKHFSFNTNPSYNPFRTDRISWSEMVNSALNAKISFAPDGATAKTERQLFVPAFSVMMKQEDSVEYPFEWIDGVNCLELVHDFVDVYDRNKESEYEMNGHNLRVMNKQKTKEKILEWLSKPNELYDIYCNGYQNAKNYELPNYFRNHIGETIKKYL